jgi:hypothetical protein
MTNVDSDFDYCIEIKKGIGIIEFGLSTDDVEQYLGLPNETEIVDPATESTVMWYYRKLKLQIIFQRPDWPSAAPTKEPKRIVQLVTTHPAATLWGTKIVGRTKDQVLDLFGERGHVNFIDSTDPRDTLGYKSIRMESIRVTLDFRDNLLCSILWGKVDRTIRNWQPTLRSLAPEDDSEKPPNP